MGGTISIQESSVIHDAINIVGPGIFRGYLKTEKITDKRISYI